MLESLPEDPFELALGSGDELNATEPEEHESTRTLQAGQSSNPHQGAGSSESPCTELCCSAGSEKSQSSNFKQDRGVLDQAKMLVNDHLCNRGTSNFHAFIFVALNIRYTAAFIVKVLMIPVLR